VARADEAPHQSRTGKPCPARDQDPHADSLMVVERWDVATAWQSQKRSLLLQKPCPSGTSVTASTRLELA
jgi:hypothetical protein